MRHGFLQKNALPRLEREHGRFEMRRLMGEHEDRVQFRHLAHRAIIIEDVRNMVLARDGLSFADCPVGNRCHANSSHLCEGCRNVPGPCPGADQPELECFTGVSHCAIQLLFSASGPLARPCGTMAGTACPKMGAWPDRK